MALDPLGFDELPPAPAEPIEHLEEVDMIVARVVANAEALRDHRITPARAAREANEGSLAFMNMPSAALGSLYIAGQMLALATIHYARRYGAGGMVEEKWREAMIKLAELARETSLATFRE